ncbi:MAG: endo-1,4-beta-xylanase [Cyclobacteriaceae bacterium]|nr:endo-1,4-beta-xylanase [Cyclobacteriaceae bacterium]
MKKFNHPFALIFMLGLLLVACTRTETIPTGPSLKKTFADDFLIGTALSIGQIEEKDSLADALIREQFNALTAENIMKSMFLQPEWGKFDFALADKLVDYGKKNNMAIIGHTLVWHSQLPRFVYRLTDKDSVSEFFTNHITTVASRYDGKILGWDVVNEALNEDGTMRGSIFYRLLGEDYVTEAFRLAQLAAPNTELYYNDYNIEQPNKRAGAIALIKKIKEAGVRIDGVGIQGHWHARRIPLKDIEESILEYTALGLKVMITELDVELLPRNFTGADISERMKMKDDPAFNPYVAGVPDSVQQQLASDYEALFKLFLKHRDHITRVTFWGVNDGQSWLNGWPAPGRTNHPLLFDRDFKPKPAFYKVIEIKDNLN